MDNISLILFDLDGTLTDPGEGITNSVMYALERCGIKTADRSALYKFIGPPLLDSFHDFYGFSDERAREALAYYREYFSEKGIFENKVYDGILALLERLKSACCTLAVATSKPEVFAKRILGHFALSDYFSVCAGADMGEKRSTKADVIERALSLANTPPERAIMIGDREHDVIGAKKFGIETIGVLYGYGSQNELTAAGAKYIAKTPSDIADIIIGKQ